MNKLEKIKTELERARIKREDWTRREKELEERYREEENSMIHDMVHAANLTPEQLAKIIDLAAKNIVGEYPSGEDGEKQEEAGNDY